MRTSGFLGQRLPKIEYDIFLNLPRVDPFVVPAIGLKSRDVFSKSVSVPNTLDSPSLRFDKEVYPATFLFPRPFRENVDISK
jgi:hypothetical protein